MKRILPPAAVILGLALIFGTQTASVSAATAKCPASFTVLHNDRIGTVPFPAGPYAMTVTSLSCSQASNLFRQFLSDWDGRLPGGWSVKLSGSVRVFTKKGSHEAFTATPQKKPTPGPSPTPKPSSLTCPGSFQVVHNDHIGAMTLPKGNYRINRLTSAQKITCPQASAWFAYFLNHDYAGTLPKPWTMNVASKTFFDGSPKNGFNVLKLTGLTKVLGSYPTAGESICSTNFRVRSTTTISGFTIPASTYVLTATDNATCAQAKRIARRTINSGDLPAGWRVDRSVGWFHRRGSTFGFRLDPGARGLPTAFTG